VDVQGNATISAEDVIRIAALPLGKYIGEVDEQKVADRILRDGRAKLVELRRTLPDRITLVIQERTPAAIAVSAGGIVVMDGDCVVIQVTPSVPEQPLLYVSEMTIENAAVGVQVNAPAAQIQAVCSAVAALQSQGGAEYISELNVRTETSLYMYSRSGVKVLLGDSQDMDYKLAWAVSALKDLESRGENRGTLDVSSANVADYRPES
jgi:cell division protein FtsQ